MNYRVRCFAAAKEWFGGEYAEVESGSDSLLTAGLLKRLLAERCIEQTERILTCFVAKNQAYVPDSEALDPRDEIALIPPVSGGCPDEEEDVGRYAVTRKTIDVAAVAEQVRHPDHGATLAFIGTTREHTNGLRTVHLEYEAYEPMAVRMMRGIGEEIALRWEGALCAITHRIGRVDIGEASVVIAVSAPHREACYAASRYAIERLKQRVPVWKKEIWEDGSQWQGHQLGPWNPMADLPAASEES